jgi:hypothetical protein
MKHIERFYVLYDFIQQYQANHDDSKPTNEMMASTLNIPLSTLPILLRQMEMSGMIQRPTSRQIVLVSRQPNWNAFVRPLAGETLVSR